MSEETDKFVEAMLKSAKESKETEAKQRFDKVDKTEVESIVEGIINPSSKEKKE